MKECCRKYLNEQFGGEAAIMDEIYREYASSTFEKIQEATATLAAADWTALDRVAHTLKGNALAAGDADMAETAITLRQAVALKDPAEAASLIAKLDALSKEL